MRDKAQTVLAALTVLRDREDSPRGRREKAKPPLMVASTATGISIKGWKKN